MNNDPPSPFPQASSHTTHILELFAHLTLCKARYFIIVVHFFISTWCGCFECFGGGV